MALTKEDKEYLETKFVTKVAHDEDILRLELLVEHGFDELRAILGDIMKWVKEIPIHRQRLDGHDTDIALLNRRAFGSGPQKSG